MFSHCTSNKSHLIFKAARYLRNWPLPIFLTSSHPTLPLVFHYYLTPLDFCLFFFCCFFFFFFFPKMTSNSLGSLLSLCLKCCSSNRNSLGWLQHIIHMSAKIVFQKGLLWQINLTSSLLLCISLPSFIFFIALISTRNHLEHLFMN